jgi:hypothetical protein
MLLHQNQISPNFSKALKTHFLSWNNWCSKVLNNYNLEKKHEQAGIKVHCFNVVSKAL